MIFWGGKVSFSKYPHRKGPSCLIACRVNGFLRFFNLYDKSRPENQTKLSEIDSFRTISKVLVYVLESFSLRFCSKRIDFRAILRNTMGTPVDWGLSFRHKPCKLMCQFIPIFLILNFGDRKMSEVPERDRQWQRRRRAALQGSCLEHHTTLEEAHSRSPHWPTSRALCSLQCPTHSSSAQQESVRVVEVRCRPKGISNLEVASRWSCGGANTPFVHLRHRWGCV